MRIQILLCCLLAISCCLEGADARAEPALSFSADEVSRILTLGPWPPQIAPDPSNRASGNQLAIELGRQLFFDPRMSPIGYIACVTCHQPDRAFADTKARGHGLADLERNTIALANLRLQSWYGWGGSSDSLWMASLRPILDAREIGGDAEKVAFVIRTGDGVACRYRAAFGADP
jgi:cytochrome c peroxidase